MFDRNRVDNVPEPSGVPVEVALRRRHDQPRASCWCRWARAVADVLNGASSFIEFEHYGGERSFLAKAQLAWVKPVAIPRASNLGARLLSILAASIPTPSSA